MVLWTRGPLFRGAVPGQLHLHLCKRSEHHRNQHLRGQPWSGPWRRRRCHGGFYGRCLLQLVQERRHHPDPHSTKAERQPRVLWLLDFLALLYKVSVHLQRITVYARASLTCHSSDHAARPRRQRLCLSIRCTIPFSHATRAHTPATTTPAIIPRTSTPRAMLMALISLS